MAIIHAAVALRRFGRGHTLLRHCGGQQTDGAVGMEHRQNVTPTPRWARVAWIRRNYTRAIQTLQIAIDREPENVDALILMAQAYTELDRVDEAKAIYESLINDIAPAHPSAYRNLIKIYQDEGYNAEALALMRQAAEKANSTQEFDVMLREYTPTAPVLFLKQQGDTPRNLT
ncbi:MAG: tetratricopeptide repeat protein [Christensenellales bacterium]